LSLGQAADIIGAFHSVEEDTPAPQAIK